MDDCSAFTSLVLSRCGDELVDDEGGAAFGASVDVAICADVVGAAFAGGAGFGEGRARKQAFRRSRIERIAC